MDGSQDMFYWKHLRLIRFLKHLFYILETLPQNQLCVTQSSTAPPGVVSKRNIDLYNTSMGRKGGRAHFTPFVVANNENSLATRYSQNFMFLWSIAWAGH